MKEKAYDIGYCLYARKSSEQDERQAMSIDSQIKEMQALAKRDNLNIVDIKKESHSAKQSGQRPAFNALLKDLRADKFTGVLTWAPDRLSRNAGDLGSLVDLMDGNKLQQIRTYGQSFSNTPNEKFLLMILCSQAKLENDNRAVNVKRGIRARCDSGWRPCMTPIGYLPQGYGETIKTVVTDQNRAPYIAKMFEMFAAGRSGRYIKQWFIDNNIKTRKDKTILTSMIFRMLRNPYYYGEFEYPKGSGRWYRGTHEPLITKELFNAAQKELGSPMKTKWGTKRFAFKHLLTCATCGASIVGEEKFKHLKNGRTLRYIYYHCSRQVDLTCKEPYISEEAMREQMSELVNQLVIKSNSCEHGLAVAIDRFANMIMTTNPDYRQQDSYKAYAKYVLQSGSDFERTRLARNLDIRLQLHDRTVQIC